MADHHKLSTERYVRTAVRTELQELKKQERREQIVATFQFFFAVLVFALAAAAVYSMPSWLPAVQQLMVSTGVMNA